MFMFSIDPFNFLLRLQPHLLGKAKKIYFSAFKKDNKQEQQAMASMKETNRLKVALEQAKGPSMGCWYVHAQGMTHVGWILIGQQANASWSQCFKSSRSNGR